MTEEQKKAYGERFSQVDVTEHNPNYHKTDESEEKGVAEMKPRTPLSRQRKVKFTKGK